MDENKTISFGVAGEPATEMHATLHRVDRREWRLWISVMIVILLLVAGIGSFSFSGLFPEADSSYAMLVTRAVRGLSAMVLLFVGHAVYQQIQISRIRRQLVAQVFAVDKVEVLAKEVYNLAIIDSLTGSYNRRYAEQRLASELSRSQRHGLPLTIILLDLDDFKQVNDKYGHAAGDYVLKAFAERLSKSTRGSDVAARYGGDEFAVLLPECTTDDVQFILRRLDGLRVDVGAGSLPVSYSAGWANYVAGESAEELLKRADLDLYANKRTSKSSPVSRILAGSSEFNERG